MEFLSTMNLAELSNWLPLGSFIAGLASTGHCAVMCGPLFMIFGKQKLAYQLGRISGYSLVGLLLGWIGLGLDRLGLLVSLQHMSVYFIMVFLVFWFLAFLIPTSWWQRLPGQMRIASWMGRLHACPVHYRRQAILLAGFLSALLPCAVLVPLWALVAGTGNPWQGGQMALAFVLGTLPGAFAMGWLASRNWFAWIRGRPYLRQVSAAILLCLSMIVLLNRTHSTADFRAASPMRAGDLNCGPVPLVF